MTNVLNLSNKNLHEIPDYIFDLNELEELNLSNNKISIIPNNISNLTNLKILDLSNNQIIEISNNISFLTSLEYLNLSNNRITKIPINIINCRSLIKFNYNDNPIENISPIIIRFLDRMKNIDKLEIYNDGQNIHNHAIQESIKNSIFNIMNQNIIYDENKIMYEILNDDILTCKELLVEYCNYKDYHSTLFITFKDLLCYVWTLIDNNNEIKKILNIEMLDSECKCFTGRLSRLINCLSGYYDFVQIKIADNQQISNIIVIIKQKLEKNNEYSIEKHKEEVINELKMRDFEDDIINEWLEYIN